MGGDSGHFAATALRYKRIHRWYLMLWSVCALGIVLMASWMAYIGASPDKYDNHTGSWEGCLFQPNYFYSPLTTEVKLGTFINALVFVGMLGIAMTLMGNCAMYWAWSNTRFSVPAAFFGLWCSLVGFTYYTPSPPLPLPSETNATLFIFFYWIREGYFSDVSAECGDTYDFIMVYLVLCLVMLIAMGMGTNITFFYLYQKYKALGISITKELFEAKSKYPLLITANTVMMMFMYIGAFLGKVVSSTTAVDAYADGAHTPTPGSTVYPEIYFPFAPAYMSVSSMCWAVIFVCVLYGLTNRNDNVRSFKVAAAASLLYVLVSYPSMVYIIQMYYQLDMDQDDVCNNYFSGGKKLFFCMPIYRFVSSLIQFLSFAIYR